MAVDPRMITEDKFGPAEPPRPRSADDQMAVYSFATGYTRYAPSDLGQWKSCPGAVAVAHHNALARKEARLGKACGAVYPCMPGKGGKCTGCGEDD